ncbi:CsbD family protein [Antrihabitans sp. YC2-6]|uniref:CsbD family protein n=1 Tax=Antrihabitans sp. YC2-6 TaxID=2799498 RepID=UPI0018F573DE|nr:CsbD family protein [Antrihabitans sp. YC2-6]MBJ8348138.1 CsbD family protein [Antrihabitans sp. YC2-6]
MSGNDKFRNKVDEVSGRMKEELGRATGDRNLEARGRRKRSGANLKQAFEKVKDAFGGGNRRRNRRV